jgi:putative endonuclease
MDNSYKIRKTRGDFGEAAVCDYLEKSGYIITARNYRKRVGEIDIIAAYGDTLAFVEVKTRKFGSLTEGADSVTRDKRRKLVKTARAFLNENGEYLNRDLRFDVAQITVSTDEIPQLLELEYLEDAFNPALL